MPAFLLLNVMWRRLLSSMYWMRIFLLPARFSRWEPSPSESSLSSSIKFVISTRAVVGVLRGIWILFMTGWLVLGEFSPADDLPRLSAVANPPYIAGVDSWWWCWESIGWLLVGGIWGGLWAKSVDWGVDGPLGCMFVGLFSDCRLTMVMKTLNQI